MINLKIGAKLILGFTVVVLIFILVSGYQVVSMQKLSRLQDEGAGRANDAVEIAEIEMLLDETYGVIADGIINRNLAETISNWNEMKKAVSEATVRVKELVDNDEERAEAEKFASAFIEYMDTFDNHILPILKKEDSVLDRARGAIDILMIEVRIGDVYSVMADAIINRNLTETRRDMGIIHEQETVDVSSLRRLVDTERELAWVSDFDNYYNQYLDIFETRMMPLLENSGSTRNISAIDAQIDAARANTLSTLNKISESLSDEQKETAADEAEIRRLDGEIDALITEVSIPLYNIAKALKGEQVEADELFDSTVSLTVLLAIIISLLGAVLAMVIALIITKSITKPLGGLTSVAEHIAKGDFNISIEKRKNKDEIGILLNSFKQMVESLKKKAGLIEKIADSDLTAVVPLESDRDALGKSLTTLSTSLNTVIGQVNISVGQLNIGADQVSQASQSLSQGATEQASSLEEISASVTQINSQSRQNAENATKANSLAKQSVEDADEGNKQMTALSGAMEKINTSSDEIKKIVKVIDDLAFQTNLLALNANVEAARAGKYGKGFAVVADEVRNLAVRSAAAVKETTGNVDDSIKNIEAGNKAVEATATQLKSIMEGSSKVADFLEEIATASKEQAEAIDQITKGLDQIDQVTQSNTASAEESAAAAEELASQSTQLKSMVAVFKLKNGQGTMTAASVRQLEYQAPREAVQIGVQNTLQAAETGVKSLDPSTVINLDDEDFDRF